MYRFTVAPFGSSSSPFMLAAVPILHLSKFNNEVVINMKNNMYVDNMLIGCDTEDEILSFYSHAVLRFNESSKLRLI